MVSSLLRSWHERVTARKRNYGKNKHTHPSPTVGECLFLLSSSLPTLFFPVFPLVSNRFADCRARGWERGEGEAAMGRGGEGEGSTGRREGRPRKVCSVADEAGGSEEEGGRGGRRRGRLSKKKKTNDRPPTASCTYRPRRRGGERRRDRGGAGCRAVSPEGLRRPRRL